MARREGKPASRAKKEREPKPEPVHVPPHYFTPTYYAKNYMGILPASTLIKRVKAHTGVTSSPKDSSAEAIGEWLAKAIPDNATLKKTMIRYIAQASTAIHLIDGHLRPHLSEALAKPGGKALWSPRVVQIEEWYNDLKTGGEPEPKWLNKCLSTLQEWRRELQGLPPAGAWKAEEGKKAAEAKAAKEAKKTTKASTKKTTKKPTAKKTATKKPASAKTYTEGDFTIRKNGTTSTWLVSDAKGKAKKTPFNTLKEARAYCEGKAKKPAAKKKVSAKKAPAAKKVSAKKRKT